MNATVIHAGALGDRVLIWPLLRAMCRAGNAVTLVAADEAGAHTATEINAQVGAASLLAESIERPRWTRLWRGPDEGIEPDTGVDLLVSFFTDEKSAAGRAWLVAARQAFPCAEFVAAGPPGSGSVELLWRRFDCAKLGGVELAENDGGPVVLFVGAGSEQKRWPIKHWSLLAGRLAGADARTKIRIVAGPVEAERLSRSEREAFAALCARLPGSGTLTSLRALSDVLRGARCVVSADTGPAHLAAQLGVRTLALFGPTDPAVWSPVGPCVHVLAPPERTQDMAWLEPGRVLEDLVTQQWLR